MVVTPAEERGSVSRALGIGALVFSLVLLFSQSWYSQWRVKSEELFPVLPDEALKRLNVSELDEHIRILSSDDFEGRGVGTEGERKSVNYIARQLMNRGFVGGVDEENGIEGFFQKVPLQGVLTSPSSGGVLTTKTGSKVKLVHGDQVALTTDLRTGLQVVWNDEEVVFAGFCIKAPERNHRWNDFDGVDVRGRVVLCLVNQPREDDSFGGKDAPLTYYGRWTYKFEELRRQGAKAVLLVHTNESAGYGWPVIKCWANTENVRLDPLTEEGTPLTARGWISSEVVNDSVEGGVESLVTEASRRGFRSRALDLKIDVSMELTRRFFVGTNVVGVLPADEASPTAEEAILLTAHHDHFGVGPVENTVNDCNGEVKRSGKTNEMAFEDRIYNGALDNAAGVAKLLAVASMFGNMRAKGTLMKRKLIFITPTAEEAVLLGSSYYANNPVAAPLSKTVAMVNFDGMNIWGKTKDVVGLGAEFSDIEKLLRKVADAEGLYVAEDAEPLQGLFYRSDQLPFAQRGVPAVKLTHGKDYIGKDKDYFDRVVGDYNRNRYHQVNDDYEYIQSQDNPYEGAIQEVRIAQRLIYGLANGSGRPKWKSDHEFSSVMANEEKADL